MHQETQWWYLAINYSITMELCLKFIKPWPAAFCSYLESKSNPFWEVGLIVIGNFSTYGTKLIENGKLNLNPKVFFLELSGNLYFSFFIYIFLWKVVESWHWRHWREITLKESSKNPWRCLLFEIGTQHKQAVIHNLILSTSVIRNQNHRKCIMM